jgi:hypothetical protein
MSFKVGDVCVVLAHPDYEAIHQKFVGSEVVLTAFLGAPASLEHYGNYWSGKFADGMEARFAEIILRLKRPPSYPDQFTAGDWDLIPWQPHRERA